MEAYISCDLIRSAFGSLKETGAGKKTGTECTTAVFLFLAFDALLKQGKTKEPINLDPVDGKLNRNFISAQFSTCSTVGYNENNVAWQVITLGQVCQHKASAEKRIGSNFLTTRLKLATSSGDAFVYPKRPKPLFHMGKTATGLPWGLQRHPEWRVHWPELFHHRISRTPFRDLAIYLLRDEVLVTEKNFSDSIRNSMANRFTDQLCSFFHSRIAWEEKSWPLKVNPYQQTPPEAFNDLSWICTDCDSSAQQKSFSSLEGRISYLENLLVENNIKFNKETI